MKNLHVATLFFVVLIAIGVAQDNSSGNKLPSLQKSDLEMKAIVNLRKFAFAESAYAMSHPKEGFACDARLLTQLEWPNSPTHAKVVKSNLLAGTGNYRYAATCDSDSKPASKLHIFAIPLDPHSNLRTFCATGRFGPYETEPYVATSEFPIRGVFSGNAESCLSSGELLK